MALNVEDQTEDTIVNLEQQYTKKVAISSVCASVDAEEITEDESANPDKKYEYSSVNPIENPQKQVEDASFNPEELSDGASSNKVDHNTSTSIATF